MSTLKSTLRTLHEAGLEPRFVESYAGSSLLFTKDQTAFAFDPKGNSMSYHLHQEQKEFYELAWRFAFVREATQDKLQRCNKIVVGPPTDYYQIYFFADDYSYFKVDLKAAEGTPLENVLPVKFYRGRGKTYYEEVINRPLSHAVNQGIAGQMLTDCPYEPATLPHPLIYKWVKQLLGCDLMGRADYKIASPGLT